MDDEGKQLHSGGLPAAASIDKNQEPSAQEAAVYIRSELDIVEVRQKGRELAAQLGFSSVDLTLIATVISELARNIVLYAGEGEIILQVVSQDGKRGIVVTAHDEGPGIPDVSCPLQADYPTSRSLGLQGVRRLMDSLKSDRSLKAARG